MINRNRLIATGSLLLRRLTTSTLTEAVEATASATPARVFAATKPDAYKPLYRRLSAIGTTGETVSTALHRYIREGNRVGKIDLVNCVRGLRKFKRYNHCLEIFQWMDKGKYNYSNKDLALHLNIVHKANGIAEAEKYFESLDTDSKDLYTYGALLNCYCEEKMAEKATALFEEMDKKGYASGLAFSNLMTLSMTMGKPEKVPLLVEVMKERNITVDSYCYSVLMQSYASMNDLKGVERILEEIEQEKERCNWGIYSNLASLYTKSGDTEKAELALKKLEDYLKDPQPQDRGQFIPYHFLISLYAGIGKLEAVHRAWSSLQSALPYTSNSSYLLMLQNLSRLDDLDGLLKCFEEWNSKLTKYDKRLPTIVIGACLRHDKVDEAEKVLEDVVEKSKSPFFTGHVMFISYLLEKGETSFALTRLRAVVDKLSESVKWNLAPERVYTFFKCFKEEKNVDGAEEMFGLLRKLKSIDSISYLSLLEVYLAAGKTATGIRDRMTDDGIEITSEHEKLLEVVCT